MDRRQFSGALALALGTALPPLHAARAGAEARAADTTDKAQAGWGQSPPWSAIEFASGGRLGVAVLDTAGGGVDGHRLDERFPMCSTFKWLAAAYVLRRVDTGEERLDRRIRFGKEALLSNSPITERRTNGEGMTVAELCEAAITVSDNAAANLLLQSFGGPAALTRHARSLGDTMTRLDRNEPGLNEARPGDPRDTTTPRAMATAMDAAVLGNALSPASRAQLARWLEASRTGDRRLRAGVPAGWRVGDKTGTGNRGTSNDVAVFWPPGRAPLVVAVYLTDSDAPPAQRDAAIAQVGRAVAAFVARG